MHENVKRIVIDVYILAENKVFKKQAEITVLSKFILKKNLFLSKAKLFFFMFTNVVFFLLFQLRLRQVFQREKIFFFFD